MAYKQQRLSGPRCGCNVDVTPSNNNQQQNKQTEGYSCVHPDIE